MRIYFIPYTLKVFLSDKLFHSGIDMSMMKNISALQSMGHDVRFFALSGEIDSDDYNVFIYNKELKSSEIKDYFKNNKERILESFFQDLVTFKPDLIFSNQFVSPFYEKLLNLVDVPIIFQSHLIPGFFTDLTNANLYYRLAQRNVYSLCVSKYQKKKFDAFYKREKSEWNFSDFSADAVLFPSYISERYIAKPSDGVVRHVSALNPGKKTFAIHDFLSDTERKSEIFTTDLYLSFDNTKVEEYAKKYRGKYDNDPLRITNYNWKHSDIMDRISYSLCTFVGLASYDSCPITSMESLQRGVPLILWGNTKYEHPSLEICDSYTRDKFIRVVRNKEAFIEAVDNFSTLTLDDRQELADRTYEYNSKEKFQEKLEKIINSSIKRYNMNTIIRSDLGAFINE